MSRRDFTERDIHMALDGELPSEERADYENWLEANPEMKARSARFEADRARLRDDLRRRIGRADARKADRARHREGGEARRERAALAHGRRGGNPARARDRRSGYLAGIGGLGLEAQAEDELAENAITAHTIYAAEQRHAVEVGADDKDHLLGWLSKRLGVTLIAPDLTADGFQLVGGRLLPAGHTSAAMLLYEDTNGNRISIYVDHRRRGKGMGCLRAGVRRRERRLLAGQGLGLRCRRHAAAGEVG